MIKKAFVAAALAGLAACGNPAEEADNPEPTAVEAAVAPGEASYAGTYEVNLPDGTIRTSVLNADGTFADSVDGEVVDTGTWEETAPDRVCFAHRGPDGSIAPSMCYTAGEMAEDGTFTVTPDDGPELTLKKIG